MCYNFIVLNLYALIQMIEKEIHESITISQREDKAEDFK